MRRICMHAVAACSTGNCEGREERTFEKDICGCRAYGAELATHNSCHRDCFLMVSYDKSICSQSDFFTVEQNYFFINICSSDFDAALKPGKVKGMHRVP